MIHQTVLPFKMEKTEDTITAHAGLSLLGEFIVGLRALELVDKYLPKPGSGAGYKASEYIFPLVLMLNGGGRSLPARPPAGREQAGKTHARYERTEG